MLNLKQMLGCLMVDLWLFVLIFWSVLLITPDVNDRWALKNILIFRVGTIWQTCAWRAAVVNDSNAQNLVCICTQGIALGEASLMHRN